MREPTDEWNEFDWEEALREGDRFAQRYSRLLKRFCDLPGGNELIAQHMGSDFEDKLPACEFDCDSCPEKWECEFAAPQDWGAGEEEAPPEPPEDEPAPGEDGAEEADPAAYYETDPVFVMLRQAAIGWCNIYAAVLPPEARVAGLNILFHVGRSLANLAYSIDEDVYNQPAGSIAFLKRSLGELNKALGLINRMMQERARLSKVLGALRDHLMKCNESLLDHLQEVRRKAQSGEA